MRIWDKNFCLSHCGLGHRQFHEAQRRFVDGPPVDLPGPRPETWAFFGHTHLNGFLKWFPKMVSKN